ncbi:hypothetical protein AAF712_008771 [Marasmius tenuissimus]|uniref:O-fucosyltransferase family protein n=1 Tax=Marasmius tenuissimus TaxID=585030 RepID=A0ABR2ZSR5_9AGAR
MSFQGAVEASRRPPEPPTWDVLRAWEDNLPQHDLDLPFPEGKTGKYVKFSNQIQQLGWNNVLNDLLMCAHLAYISGRAYVFQEYYWKSDYYTWPRSQFRTNPPRTPLNALISGPASGGPFEPDDPAPRSVSEKFFDKVCPKSERKILHTEDYKPQIGWASGIEILNYWAKILREEPARCVEIVPADRKIDDFPQTFDLWLWGSDRVLSLWEPFTKSPISRLFETSPVVNSAIDANEYLFLPRGPRPALSGGKKSSNAAASTWPRNPYSRVMAVHIRRGDFEEACHRLAYYNSTFYSWNLLPDLPDHFRVPAGMKWDSPEYKEFYQVRCYPEVDLIVKKILDSRDDYIKSLHGEEVVLDTMYLLTNAKGDWLAGLKERLKSQGWNSIVTSKDLILNAEQMDANMAVDMDLARRAAVFIGNGWSSFTSNIVHRRLVDGKKPISTRFW